MTLLKQDNETATLGSAIAASTNPSGDTPFNQVNINGAAVIDNTHAVRGTQSIKLSPVSGSVDSFRWTGLSSTAYAASFYLWVDTLPGTETWICNITASGVRSGMLVISNTNKLRLIDTRGTSTPVWTATNTFPTSQWVRCEFYQTVAASGASQQASYFLGDSTTAVDTSTLLTTGQTGSAAVDTVVFGKSDGGTYASPFWFDSIQFQTAASGLIGAYPQVASTVVRPTSDISNSGGWSIAGGSGSMSIALADESDTTYVQSPDNPTGGSEVVKFALLQTGLVTIKVRHNATNASPVITRTYELVQGSSTIISTRSVVLPTTITDYSWTTTSAEAANITDRSDLRLVWSDTV
ncbi:hypothetical protein ACFRFH_12195 [Leifsonia sp. NPDC056824]|uniref:hypothetical protein n=1 Tax=Leifsonia sp. NPDC056824 TaxID=3345953 RepID=UPI0036B3220B